MVEISLDDYRDSNTPTTLIITYSTLTCLVVSVHLFALMISTCLLPFFEGDYGIGYEENDIMHFYIELAWILSTGIGREKKKNKKY